MPQSFNYQLFLCPDDKEPLLISSAKNISCRESAANYFGSYMQLNKDGARRNDVVYDGVEFGGAYWGLSTLKRANPTLRFVTSAHVYSQGVGPLRLLIAEIMQHFPATEYTLDFTLPSSTGAFNNTGFIATITLKGKEDAVSAWWWTTLVLRAVNHQEYQREQVTMESFLSNTSRGNESMWYTSSDRDQAIEAWHYLIAGVECDGWAMLYNKRGPVQQFAAVPRGIRANTLAAAKERASVGER